MTAVNCLSRSFVSDRVCHPLEHRPDEELHPGPRSRSTPSDDSLKAALDTALEMLAADVPILPNLKQAQADMSHAVSSMVSGPDGGLGDELLTALIACDTVIQHGKVGLVHTVP